MTSGGATIPDPLESPEGIPVLGDPDSLNLAGVAIDSPLTTAELCRVVGSRVRELRQALNMTMSAFATHAGISLGMLSKIEHGQSAPSLSTLARLAATAKVPVTALFRGLDEEHDLVIVRAGEGHEIHHDRDGPDRLYQDLGSLRGPNRIIEPMITTITEPGGVFPLYQHPGVEFLHVLEGSLYYGYGGKAYLLNRGDTMQIHGEVAHGPVELVELPVRFISIKVYPASERVERREGDAMGLMFVADWISETGFARRNIWLWILLAAAVGLTYWECRERGYRQTVLLWWVSFVAITHVVGYLILRFVVRPPQDD